MELYSRKLFDIIHDDRIQIVGDFDDSIEVSGWNLDSRKIKPSEAYVAVKGTRVDGHKYIPDVITKGVSVVVCSTLPDSLADGVAYILLDDFNDQLGEVLANFYDHPSRQLKLVGVTGTNGKSTVVTLLYRLFKSLGFKVGLLSTIKYVIADEEREASHTTPDILKVHKLIFEMANAGCELVFMEVSSHGIDQGRVAGLYFEIGAFTNLSHDHLDYHSTYQEYIDTKKKFFDRLPFSSFAITNADDKQGSYMLQNTKASKRSYSLHTVTDYKAKLIESSITGMQIEINREQLFSPLTGKYNAYNLTLVYAVADVLGYRSDRMIAALSALRGAEGRFELVHGRSGGIGIVDYAHTPDAVDNLLKTVRQIISKQSKIITVIGCGGDRDRAKRPIMARVAVKYSDLVILTSDNPRSENPDKIIEEMESGLDEEQKRKTLLITDRKQAIKTAAKMASTNDVIVVAGKGHEKYQEIEGKKLPFDDIKELKTTLF